MQGIFKIIYCAQIKLIVFKLVLFIESRGAVTVWKLRGPNFFRPFSSGKEWGLNTFYLSILKHSWAHVKIKLA